MSELRVNAIRHTGASSDAVTLATDGTCTAKITNNLSNRNLIINGAMQCAQYGGTSGSSGFKAIDRWRMDATGASAAITQSQHALTSSDTGPWEKGFRYSYHLLNAGQDGADVGDFLYVRQPIEAQNIATSGWDYTSASSYITLSFWIRSSVAQNFYGYIQTIDGTNYSYVWETGSLSANTWTKITKTIPGNSNLVCNTDNGHGLDLMIVRAFDGTDRTASMSLNTWAAYSGSSRTPDQTSTFWTTAGATLEVTGVQLEVGDVATDFEHRSYGDELARCQRYYWQNLKNTYLFQYGETHKRIEIYFPVPMRTTPTYDHSGGSITIDSGTHQSEEFFCAYSASDYDGPGRNYSEVKFNAEL